jgi:hypothetical protein
MHHRYLSLALCTAHDPDAEILPGVVAGPLDLWPVPQLYDARLDQLIGDCPVHDWAEVDVQLAPGVSAADAAAYLRRVAAWLDEHGAELLAHPRVVEALGSAAPIERRIKRTPRAHLTARDNLRVAVEERAPTRKPKP